MACLGVVGPLTWCTIETLIQFAQCITGPYTFGLAKSASQALGRKSKLCAACSTESGKLPRHTSRGPSRGGPRTGLVGRRSEQVCLLSRAVLLTIFVFVLVLPSPGGSRGGSGLSCHLSGERGFGPIPVNPISKILSNILFVQDEVAS